MHRRGSMNLAFARELANLTEAMLRQTEFAVDSCAILERRAPRHERQAGPRGLPLKEARRLLAHDFVSQDTGMNSAMFPTASPHHFVITTRGPLLRNQRAQPDPAVTSRCKL